LFLYRVAGSFAEERFIWGLGGICVAVPTPRLRRRIDTGTVAVASNKTGVYQNGTLIFGISTAPGGEGPVFEFGNWTSLQLDSNTWLNYTTAAVGYRQWIVLYYIMRLLHNFGALVPP
jgi:hypothetical protein